MMKVTSIIVHLFCFTTLASASLQSVLDYDETPEHRRIPAKSKLEIAGKFAARSLTTSKCTSTESFAALSGAGEDIADEAIDFAQDVVTLAMGDEDTAELAHRFLLYMDKVLDIATETMAACWSTEALAVTAYTTVSSGFDTAISAVSSIPLPDQGVTVSSIDYATFIEEVSDAAGGFLTYIKELGEDGRKVESGTDQINSVMEMLKGWRNAVKSLDQQVDDAGGDSDAWATAKVELNSMRKTLRAAKRSL